MSVHSLMHIFMVIYLVLVVKGLQPVHTIILEERGLCSCWHHCIVVMLFGFTI